MHLLSTRFAVNSNLWLDSCALVVAVSKQSIEMVKLLLDSCYGSSPPGGQVRSEVNRALLETVYKYGEEKDSTNRTHQDITHEIIQMLITEGGANPHLPSMIQFPGYMKSLSEYDGEIQEETPLTAAVRAGDSVAIQCMSIYSTYLHEAKQERRNDPMLAQQPESYFRALEEREDDIINSSIDAALVASLFLLRYTGNLDYGKCGLVLYEQSDRTLSHQGLQWLEKCISTGRLIPTMPQGSTSDDSFEVALIRYHIPNCRGEKKSKSINDTCSSHTDMDWSYVLAALPWFKSRMNGVNCIWLKRVMLDPKLQELDYQGAVKDDEFDLVVEGGVKLCAHRSIVSARCGKLAAQIRFTESNSSEGGLTVHVDLPQLVAKMLLSHIYHGSIVFGLRGSPTEQCQQLLELALLAEEYLCPSLLLECELRLLERSSCTLCICPQCSGSKQILANQVSPTDQVVYRAELQCLEKARDNLNESLSMFCKPIGVHIYKSSIVSSNSKSIITAQNGLDILAVAQQLEHSSQFNQQSLHHLKYKRPSSNSTINGSSMSSLSNQFDHISLRDESNKDGVTTQYTTNKISIMEREDNAEYISVPFAAAKSMSVRSMLCNFPVVLKSESYARQCKSNSYQEEEDMDEIDASFSSQADKNKNGVLLLQACLEEL